MKNKLLLSLLTFFASALCIGTTYSTWIMNKDTSANNTMQVEIPT